MAPSLVVAAFVAILTLAVPVAADPLRATTSVNLTGARIVMVAPSVEVYEIGAGGQSALKADWTEAARGHVRAALEAELVARKTTVVTYRPPEAGDRQAEHLQIFKVHALVAQTVMRHAYGGDDARLPSKEGRFEWSLGPRARVLAEDHVDAGYALFVTFVEGHSSGGRVAMNVAAVVLGGSIVTGRQTGIASLVNLETGDVVWFNLNRESDGDLRTAEDATKAVRRLLKEFPPSQP
jgi:hypothetical protein